MLNSVKRLQILIDEELDEALALEARRTSTSKAELIRRYVCDQLVDVRSKEDPVLAMAGDATSFQVMSALRIGEALALTGDFTVAGSSSCGPTNPRG
jgi:hypothetical protein